QQVHDQSQPHAMEMALQTARIFPDPSVPTNVLRSFCRTVKTLHRLTQEVDFSPSSTPTSTSVGDPRSVEVTAATVTVCSNPIREGGLRTRTGRRLSGRWRFSSQISPRFTRLATPAGP